MQTVTVKVNQTLAGIDTQSNRPYPVKFKPGQLLVIPADIAKELGAHKADGLVSEVKDKAEKEKAQPLNVAWEQNRKEAAALEARTKAQQREKR